MDRQGRLTKWSELELGARYQWFKGGVGGPFYKLAEINQRHGYIKMLKDGCDTLIPFRKETWPSRFRKVA